MAAAIAIRARLPTTSVLVVEKQNPDAQRIGESCPPDIVLLLQQLGIAKAFYRGDHETCPGYASVWGNKDPGYNDFIVNPMGPSWRLNRTRFDAMLAAKAEQAGARLMWDTGFQTVVRNTGRDSGYLLHLCRKRDKILHSIQAGFVIDASGAKARFARALNIHKTINDQLFATARFANVLAGQGSKQVQLEATNQGWCYHARLPEQKIVSMIVTEKSGIAPLRERDYRGFNDTLTATTLIGPSVDKLTLDNSVYRTYAIQSGLLAKLEGSNWMAIGDAASSFDPIAAQGIYKGLSHGLMAAEKVAAWREGVSAERSIFSEKVIQQHAHYLKNRAYVYGQECRWPNSIFWRHRQDTLIATLAKSPNNTTLIQ